MSAMKTEELEGRPRSQPDDLINFRQLRSSALQAAELDIYEGDDIGCAAHASAAKATRHKCVVGSRRRCCVHDYYCTI